MTFIPEDLQQLVWISVMAPKNVASFGTVSTIRLILASRTHTRPELPRYIERIHGYSADRERVFFEGSNGAYFSSSDGRAMELDEEPTGVVTSPKVVPGKQRTEIGTILWPGQLTNYNADFDGLYDDSVLLAQWSTCCGADPGA